MRPVPAQAWNPKTDDFERGYVEVERSDKQEVSIYFVPRYEGMTSDDAPHIWLTPADAVLLAAALEAAAS